MPDVSDFSPEGIALLQKPATDAADKVLEDAEKVNNDLTKSVEALEERAETVIQETGEAKGFADQATKEISINNTCTVFAESEVISRLAAGEKAADVARGAHVAIAKRVMGMCNRVGYEPKVVMTGGVALNANMVDALSKEMGCAIEVVPHCQAAGAIGAAVFAYEIYNK